jgi:hypothetical protein
MTRRHVTLKPKPHPARVARLEELLRIAAAYEQHKRPLPGGLRRELALLADCWPGHAIPQCVVDAKRVLGRIKQSNP